MFVLLLTYEKSASLSLRWRGLGRRGCLKFGSFLCHPRYPPLEALGQLTLYNRLTQPHARFSTFICIERSLALLKLEAHRFTTLDIFFLFLVNVRTEVAFLEILIVAEYWYRLWLVLAVHLSLPPKEHTHVSKCARIRMHHSMIISPVNVD